jgi:MFS family permease
VAQKNKRKSIKKLTLINLIALMLGLQLGLTAYIISTFLEKQVGEKAVGLLFLLGYLISLYALIKLHTLIRGIGKSQTFFLFVAITWISLLGMGAFWFHPVAILFAVFFLVGGSILWAALDVLIETYSEDKTTGKTRGLFLTILNTGVIIAPLISTWLVQTYENGFQLVFYTASFFVFIPLIILAIFFSERKCHLEKRRKDFSIVKELLEKKDVARIYWVAFLLDLFYAVMVVYTPVYLLSIGLDWLEIGKIFAVMLIPFVVLQYPLGLIADKKTGEKNWLIAALVVMSVSTISIGFIDVPHIGTWMLILLSTRIGAATIEVMRDTYFYKKIGPKDIELMDFYRTTKSLSYIIGMPIFSLLLLFSPLNYVFIVLGTVIGVGVIPLFKLKDTEVSK